MGFKLDYLELEDFLFGIIDEENMMGLEILNACVYVK